jgi:uncharacterized protein
MSAEDQYIYRIQPTRLGMLVEGPTDREQEAIAEHFAYLQGLVTKGILLMAGRTLTEDENTFGIVVFTARSEGDAKLVMLKDPAIMQDVMRGEVFPFRVALWSPVGWPQYDGRS